MERMLEKGIVLLFPQFSFLPETSFSFPVRFILSSAIPFDLGRSKTSLYAKEKQLKLTLTHLIPSTSTRWLKQLSG